MLHMNKDNGALRTLVRKRLLEDVFGSQRNEFSVLILDHRATRVLDSALFLYDISQHGIATVESLHKKRPALPDMPAIYLIESTQQSLDLVLDDFNEASLFASGSHKYHSVSLFFLTGASPTLLEQIKANKRFLRICRKVAEVNLDFLTVDTNIFHFDDQLSFLKLNYINPSKDFVYERERLIRETVTRLITTCATLNEYPYIQYCKSKDRSKIMSDHLQVNGNSHSEENNSTLAENVAGLFQQQMNDFISENDKFWWNGDGKDNHGSDENRGTLIILDRLDDLLTPLAHDFSYQSCIHDLLNVKDEVVRFALASDSNNTLEHHRIIISKQDKIFQSLKYDHMSNVLEKLNQVTQELDQFNPQRKLGASGSENDSGSSEIQGMIHVVQNLNQYGELKERHLNNLLVAQKVMEYLEKGALVPVLNLEEVLACLNVDRDARHHKFSDMVDKAVEILQNQKVSTMTKTRLISLMMLTQADLDEAQRSKLISSCQPSLSSSELEILSNFNVLKPSLAAFNSRTKGSGSVTKSRFFKSIDPAATLVEEEKRKVKMLASPIEPRLRSRLVKLVERELTSGIADFETDATNKNGKVSKPSAAVEIGLKLSYIIEPPPAILKKRQNSLNPFVTESKLSVRRYLSPDGSSNDTSTRMRSRNSLNPLSRYASQDDWVSLGPRLIVFVLGGVTYSEMAQFNKLMISYRRGIIVGSTHIINAKSFLEEIEQLKKESLSDALAVVETRMQEEATRNKEFDAKLKDAKPDDNAPTKAADTINGILPTSQESANPMNGNKLGSSCLGCIPRQTKRIKKTKNGSHMKT